PSIKAQQHRTFVTFSGNVMIQTKIKHTKIKKSEEHKVKNELSLKHYTKSALQLMRLKKCQRNFNADDINRLLWAHTSGELQQRKLIHCLKERKKRKLAKIASKRSLIKM
ncbi:unnamed protein product, partial [Ceratitis capitata]